MAATSSSSKWKVPGSSDGGSSPDSTVSDADSRSLRFRYSCVQRGYSWSGPLERPDRCLSCDSRRWRDAKELCRCRRCGHMWLALPDVQTTCPSCDSSDWMEEITVEPPVPDSDRGLIIEMYGCGYGCISIASETGYALFEVISVIRDSTGDPEPVL